MGTSSVTDSIGNCSSWLAKELSGGSKKLSVAGSVNGMGEVFIRGDMACIWGCYMQCVARVCSTIPT